MNDADLKLNSVFTLDDVMEQDVLRHVNPNPSHTDISTYQTASIANEENMSSAGA